MNRKLVLIADDDESDRFFLSQAFAELCPDAEVQEVRDGQAAIDYLSGAGPYGDRDAFPFPVHVILDLKIPRRSGLEVLAWLRTRPGLKNLPVTVLTGSGLPEDIRNVESLGAHYIVKPVEYLKLRELVGELCRRAGLGPKGP